MLCLICSSLDIDLVSQRAVTHIGEHEFHNNLNTRIVWYLTFDISHMDEHIGSYFRPVEWGLLLVSSWYKDLGLFGDYYFYAFIIRPLPGESLFDANWICTH
jgi:hypothetical protein